MRVAQSQPTKGSQNTHFSVHPVEFQVEFPAASSFQKVHVGTAVVMGHLKPTVSPALVHSWPNENGRPAQPENSVNVAVTSAAEHASVRVVVSVALYLPRCTAHTDRVSVARVHSRHQPVAVTCLRQDVGLFATGFATEPVAGDS